MSLDLDRARETFESSTDFTIGLEEEFAILDPATLELEHRFEDVYAACQARRRPGRVGGRRADRLRDRDPLRAGGELRRGGRAAARAPRPALRAGRRDGPGAGGDGDPPLGQLPRPADHRHPALQPPAPRTRLRRPAQQHLEHARAHGRARGGPRDRRLRLAARAAAAAAGRLGQLALPRPPRQRPAHGPHRDLHPHLPPLRRAQPLRRLGQLRRVRRHAGADRLGGRVDAAVVERAPAPLLRHGRGADLRRPDARRGVLRPGRPDRGLHRADSARPTTSTATTAAAHRCATARSRRTSGGRSATG